jgi:RNA polymerase sigma-70 factor (ECF subfamily)
MGFKAQSKPDQELIQRCLDGDIAAGRQLYDLHKEILYNVALRLHQNVQDAEDSLQEAFIKIFRGLQDFKGDCKLATWMYRIVLNTCLTDMNRKKLSTDSYEKMDEEQQWQLSDSAEDPTLQVILEQELAQLPIGYRTVFILYEVEGFSHQEIAAMLEITVGTSKSQLHKAKRMLQKRLKPFFR